MNQNTESSNSYMQCDKKHSFELSWLHSFSHTKNHYQNIFANRECHKSMFRTLYNAELCARHTQKTRASAKVVPNKHDFAKIC